MRKLGITGLILFTFFAFCGRPDLSEGSGSPKLILKEKEYDIGRVMQGTVIKHTFKVLNTGDETLEIKNVRPG